MEGNKSAIPLNSSLDINSQDMLVKISEPKFSFNRQKFQGSLLQTSVRYEDEGWFAGWWGHKFRLRSTRSDHCVPPLNSDQALTVTERKTTWGIYYNVKHEDTGYVYTVNPVRWVNISSGQNIVIVRDGEEVTITGQTQQFLPFTLVMDPYTGEIKSFVGTDLVPSVVKVDYKFEIMVQKPLSGITDDFIIVRINNVPMLEGNALNYVRPNSTTGVWGQIFSATDATGAVVSLDPEFYVTSYVTNNPDEVSETYVVKYEDDTIHNIECTFSYTNKWVADIFITATVITQYVAGISVADDCNVQNSYLKSSTYTELKKDNSAIFEYNIPIWLRHQINFDYTVQFQAYDKRPVDLSTTAKFIFTFIKDDVLTINWANLDIDSDEVEVVWYNVFTNSGGVATPHTVTFTLNSIGMASWTTTKKRYTYLKIHFKQNTLTLKTWQPYRKTPNPVYDARPTVFNTSLPVPTELEWADNTKTGDYFVVNAAKVQEAKNAVDPDDIPDYIIHEIFAIKDGYDPSTNPDYIVNPDYNIDAENGQPYDPRPIIPRTGAPTWASMSIVNPNINTTVSKDTARTDVDTTRYFLTKRDFIAGDYFGISPYWEEYWPDIPKPEEMVDGLEYFNTEGYVVNGNLGGGLICNPSSVPPEDDVESDNEDAYGTNDPEDSDGQPCPPRFSASTGTLHFQMTAKDSNIMAQYDLTAKTKWQYRFIIRRRTDSSSRTSYSGWNGYNSYYTRYFTRFRSSTQTITTPWTDAGTPYNETVYDQPQYNYNASIKDAWVLQLRCINTGDTYGPVPVNGAYFTINIPCTGEFRKSTDMLSQLHKWDFPDTYPVMKEMIDWIFTTYPRKLEPATYNNSPYDSYYKVLNHMSMYDPALWKDDQLTVALAVPGVSYFQITTPNIMASGIDAFSLQTVQNAVVGSQPYRIDDKNLYGNDLKFIMPTLSNVSTGSSVAGNQKQITLKVVFDTVLNPMYMLSKEAYTEDTTTGEITGWTNGAFPAWITDGNSAKLFNNTACGIYFPSLEANTTVNITGRVIDLAFITGGTFAESNDNDTQYNGNLFSFPSLVLVATMPTLAVLPNYNQTVTIGLETGNTVQFTYAPDTGTISGVTINVPNYRDVTTTYADPATLIAVALKSKTEFTIELQRSFIMDYEGNIWTNTPTIGSQENGIIQLNPVTYGIINTISNQLQQSSILQQSAVERDGQELKIYLAQNNTAELQYIPEGIISKNSETLVYERIYTVPNYIDVDFTVNGVEHTLEIDTSLTAETYLQYLCTDIRTDEAKEVYRRDTSDIIMFVKQFWSSTVDTENYWWIDKNHVLELTKYDIILYKKGTGVHDWMGDNWEVDKRATRGIFIKSEDIFYMCTSATSASALLIKLINSNDTGIEIKWINPLNANYEVPVWTSVTIPLTKVEFGNALKTNELSSYNALDVNGIIVASRKSATVINNFLLIGIAAGRGLNQWCIKINLTSKQVSIVNGYGHVGVDGSLTGGQIPQYCCGSNGFNGIVNALDTLPEKAEGSFQVPTTIVGTGDSVWFIRQKVDNIVSHMKWNGTEHSIVALALNNNVAYRDSAAIFRSTAVLDIIPQTFNLISLLGIDNAALNLIASVMTPALWFMFPRYSVAALLAQSCGQYAYVQRNSAQTQIDSATTDRDIVFNKYSYAESNVVNSASTHVLAQIVVKSVSIAFETADHAIFMNKDKNETSVADKKKENVRLCQYYSDSVGSMVGTALTSSGLTITLASEIPAQLSLDMFYNISNKSQCFAGPGFVNHNFQAQCVAQSRTDVMFDGKQAGFYTILVQLTILTLTYQNKLNELIRQGILSLAESIGGAQSGSQPGPIIPVGQIVATTLNATAVAMNQLIALNNAVIEALPDFAGCLGGHPNGITSNLAAVAKNNPSCEGTHTYGNKSMSFMWPTFGTIRANTYTNEYVEAGVKTYSFECNLRGANNNGFIIKKETGSRNDIDNPFMGQELGDLGFNGKIYTPQIMCQGKSSIATAPANMTVVEGTTTFLSPSLFKNEQIGVNWPTFAQPPLHDYMINDKWQLGLTAVAGEIVSVSCDDTKLIDGAPSNIIIDTDFCGIASSYVVMEIKDEYDERYLHPYAVTPDTIALNINRVNVIHDARAYHAFDGQSNRIIKWTGGSGMDKELEFKQYVFQINDHFKRSNIWPPSHYFGQFDGPPAIAIRSYDPVNNSVMEEMSGIGLTNEIPGEQKDLQRYSLPVHSEVLSTLPVVNRTLAPYKVGVVEGVTSLCTEIRNTQGRYKAPSSVDFNINGELYRWTAEFICKLTTKGGIVAVQDVSAAAGISYVGATTKEAYGYSLATRLYYSFSGGSEIQKRDILNRFYDLKEGRWDFINQEVILKAVLNNAVVDSEVNHLEDVVLRLDGGQFTGEVWPPNETIYNERSGYKLYSMAGGLVFQGPKRFIVSRFVALDHMLTGIKLNKGKWIKVNREEFNYNRDYGWRYEDYDTMPPVGAVVGWTHNPFLLVTSMLGTGETTDNKYEWELTWAWTEQMDKIFEQNEYVTVNVMAEVISEGGTVLQRPTHVYLTKELFTRQGNAGYYTHQFQSNAGAGNRERLYVWSDGFIALEDLEITAKMITEHRTQPLTIQVDIQDMQEL